MKIYKFSLLAIDISKIKVKFCKKIKNNISYNTAKTRKQYNNELLLKI